jgi:hypothetical protein
MPDALHALQEHGMNLKHVASHNEIALVLCVFLSSGCAATTLRLPPQDAQPVQAQFGLRFHHAGMTLPLQGGVQMAENEGRLGVIFPHGRTLGVCRYQGGGMECTPAGGERRETRFVLRQTGLAVYRLLPALTREFSRNAEQDSADWAVRWKKTDAGLDAEYRDTGSQVTIDIHFTEIARP